MSNCARVPIEQNITLLNKHGKEYQVPVRWDENGKPVVVMGNGDAVPLQHLTMETKRLNPYFFYEKTGKLKNQNVKCLKNALLNGDLSSLSNSDEGSFMAPSATTKTPVIGNVAVTTAPVDNLTSFCQYAKDSSNGAVEEMEKFVTSYSNAMRQRNAAALKKAREQLEFKFKVELQALEAQVKAKQADLEACEKESKLTYEAGTVLTNELAKVWEKNNELDDEYNSIDQELMNAGSEWEKVRKMLENVAEASSLDQQIEVVRESVNQASGEHNANVEELTKTKNNLEDIKSDLASSKAKTDRLLEIAETTPSAVTSKQFQKALSDEEKKQNELEAAKIANQQKLAMVQAQAEESKRQANAVSTAAVTLAAKIEDKAIQTNNREVAANALAIGQGASTIAQYTAPQSWVGSLLNKTKDVAGAAIGAVAGLKDKLLGTE